jgi:hypothetical protein
MALHKSSEQLLKKVFKILELPHNDWVATATLAESIGVKPAKIRSVLEWYTNNHDDERIEWRKPSSRLVEWRSKFKSVQHKDFVKQSHPDDPLIDGLADMLGQKEKYRQALLKIRQVIDDALGDVISH